MPFDRGSMTFQTCQLPRPMPEDALARFAAKAAGSLDAVRDEPQLGWVSGRHLLERRIDEETAYLGGYLHLCLRHAERKIPPALLRAECRMTELAAMAEKKTDRLLRKERRAIREEVTARLLPEMPPQLSGTPFVLDADAQRVFVGTASLKQLDVFLAFFQQSIGFEPVPLTPELIAEESFGVHPDAVPSLNFSPDLPDAAAAGTLGQNFLTWLWFFQEQRGGALPRTQLGEFGLRLDGPLFFVGEGGGGLEFSIRKGMPTISAEAKAALYVGKKLKQAKLVLVRGRGEEWSGSLNADDFVVRGLRLPQGEAMDPGSVFEERMTNLYVFEKVFTALFERFLNEVSVPDKIRALQKEIKEWVRDRDSR